MNAETRTCQNCKSSFTIEPEDLDFYKKIDVPPPTFCYLCRAQRRLMFRNERNFYRTKSGKSGKEIFSIIPPEAGVNIYDEKEWYSDDWSALDYGKEYDFGRSFFEQFHELAKSVPRINTSNVFSTNSDYCANAGYLKNCYLIFNSNHNEDCAYGNGVDKCRDSYDNSHMIKCERTYHSFWMTNCYEARFSSYCEDCTDIWLCRNLRGCSNCFGCMNLVNKKYHVFNQPYSKEDYEKKILELNPRSWSNLVALRERVHMLQLSFPVKFIQGAKNLNVSGEYISHSKNVVQSYLVREGENIKYGQYLQIPPAKDCYDVSIWGEGMELDYENVVTGYGISNSRFCFETWKDIRNLEYCGYCVSSHDCFGCFGLRNKEFCILNKQYSKEGYRALRKKIIEHMDDIPYVDKAGKTYKYGEFFPAEHSPYAYNTTVAGEQFPLSREEAIKIGYTWRDIPATEYQTTMKSEETPDLIDDVQESILKEILQCAKCKRAYRLIVPELNFLKAEGIPAPRWCIDCRHKDRISQRSKMGVCRRHCQCAGAKSENGVYANTAAHPHGAGHCPNEFETSYAPDRPEIVYCESCYQSEVV